MTARQEPTPVLKETEVQALYDKTNWSSWFEAQRMNFLVLSYQLGQRPESLVRLCVGNFQPKVLEGGQKSIQVNFGTMKNLQGDQANSSKAVHHQLVVEHNNPKLCAVAAYERQFALPEGSQGSADPFFPTGKIDDQDRTPPKLPQFPLQGALHNGFGLRWAGQ